MNNVPASRHRPSLSLKNRYRQTYSQLQNHHGANKNPNLTPRDEYPQPPMPGIDGPIKTTTKTLTLDRFLDWFFNSYSGIFSMLGAGLVLLMLSGSTFIRYLGSGDYVQVPGQIVSSKFQVDDGEGTTTGSYFARIKYTYSVNDKVYESDRVYFGYGGDWVIFLPINRTQAENLVEEYPVGTEVIVYYDSDDPAMSVLKKEASWFLYLMFVGGMALVGSGMINLTINILNDRGRATSTTPSSN